MKCTSTKYFLLVRCCSLYECISQQRFRPATLSIFVDELSYFIRVISFLLAVVLTISGDEFLIPHQTQMIPYMFHAIDRICYCTL